MEATVRETATADCIELRVHGVSGTPVTSMLDDPDPVMIVGDGLAGFYRRGPRPNAPHTAADEGTEIERTLEAYSWGSLTAGSATRAAWLLLLPFTLVNVAGWMHTDVSRSSAANRLQRFVAVLLRLLALTLTFTLVLAFVGVGMDVAAWQRGLRTCDNGPPTGQPIKLVASWLGDCGEATMLVGALVPLIAIGVLWVLALRTGRYEKRKMLPSAPNVRGVPLSEPGYWDGASVHRRMRRCHLASGLALVGLMASRATPADPIAVEIAVLAAIGLSLAWLAAPWFTDHVASRSLSPTAVRVCDWVVLGTFLLGAATALLGVIRLATVGPPARRSVALPSFESLVEDLFAVQVAMLAIILVSCIGVTLAATRTGPETQRVSPPALYGVGPALLASLGVLLAAAMAPALAVVGPRLVDLRNGPQALLRFRLPTDIRLPAQYEIAAALSLVLVPVVAVIGVVLWLQSRTTRASAQVRVEGAYTAQERDQNPDETRAVVSSEAAAALTDYAGWHVAAITISALALAVVSVLAVARGADFDRYGFRIGRMRVDAVDAGMIFVTFVVLALVVLGVLAYRSKTLRRTVGILWDLGTFWPRATHPLAPPSYSERTVPDIAHRLTRLTESGAKVVLAAHSQGSIIAAAVLVRLSQPTLGRVALLTYGSPLERLYGTYFPAYFGPATLEYVKTCCSGRWVNLHRATDPIGGAVGVAGVDAPIERDPESLVSPTEVPAILRPRGHSGFPEHSQYAVAVRTLVSDLGCLRQPTAGATTVSSDD